MIVRVPRPLWLLAAQVIVAAVLARVLIPPGGVSGQGRQPPAPRLVLSYDKPALVFEEALPLGIRLTASRAGLPTFALRFESQLRHEIRLAENGDLLLFGRAPVHAEPNYRRDVKNPIVYDEAPDGRGMRFAARARVIRTDGRVGTTPTAIAISGAREALLAVAIETSFAGFDREPGRGPDPVPAATTRLDAVARRSFESLKDAHVRDYRALFDRVTLDLGHTSQEGRTTDRRLREYAAGAPDPGLEVLYFQFGRYLLISGSRPARYLPPAVIRFPADKATGINPDTHLVITFPSAPALGNAGKIRIYDAADNKLVDTLDLSIPPGPPSGGGRIGAAPYTPVPYEYVTGHVTNANTVPGTPSGVAVATPATSQLTIIGGFTDAFHFYPVIIHDNVATIYPHNNLLDYGKTYYVQIDPGVLTLADGSFTGFGGKSSWTFSTKPSPPPADSARIVVSGDGTGDFNTVQGAIDFVPDRKPRRITIFIRNGMYEEIVYFRNKTNITFLGEDREKVQVFYANNEVFNPHPPNVATNEWPGTFPSRRAAFMGDHSNGIHLVNLTVKTTARGQAEGLLLVGEQNIVSHVTIQGSGDALQVNGSVYLTESLIVGDGDTILGRGPAFFNNCELNSRGAYMWTRNTSANHGNVFLNCRFQTLGNGVTEIARAPTNGGRNYPNAEVVLINCVLAGISPVGWGTVGGDTSDVHYWEYKSTNISDGTPVDVSQRHLVSRQLTIEKDAQTIANYSNPTWVLGGWTPKMAPLILAQPAAVTAVVGQTVTFSANVAAIPEATYQWFKNGAAIRGATNVTLKLDKVQASDAADYTVVVTNGSGSATSRAAALMVK